MNNLFFPPLTTNLNLPIVSHKRTPNSYSISIMFYLCLVPLTRTRIHMTRMTMRREETRSKSRQWCPTEECLRLWDALGHAVVGDGRIEAMRTCPIIGQAGVGAVADEQRRQSPRLQTSQAGPVAEDAPEPLGHPNLGSDPHREGFKISK